MDQNLSQDLSQNLSQDLPRHPSWKTLFTRGLLLAALCCGVSASVFADEALRKSGSGQETSAISESFSLNEVVSLPHFTGAFFDRLDLVLGDLDPWGPVFARQEEDEPQLNGISQKV